MADSIQDMRERRDALAKDTRNLLDKNTHAEWTDDCQTRYDENVAEIERIDSAIEREQRVLDLTAEREFNEAGGQTHEAPIRDIFQKWMRRGDNGLTAEDWGAVRNDLSTGTDSEGGYTVPTEVANDILEALKAYGGMRQVAEIMQTDSGNPMQFPTSDGTSEVGEIVAENTAAAEADPSFGVKNLDVYKYSSKVVAAPIELLQDSNADIEAFIRQRLVTRLGRITNQHFTTGTGSSQPNGVITAAPVGRTTATGNVATVTYDDLLELEHSVDPAYREQGARWMLNDDTLKTIRGLKDSDGRPIWLPSYDAGIRGGVPQELLGMPITINQDVASPAADAKTIAFGDFSKYVIRDVMQITMYRFADSPYVKKGQIGFLAWMRSGGNFIDVGGAVKTLQQASS